MSPDEGRGVLEDPGGTAPLVWVLTQVLGGLVHHQSSEAVGAPTSADTEDKILTG